MQKFKKGDTVRCIRGTVDTEYLVQGKDYIVDSFDESSNTLVVQRLPNDWHADRFELVTPEFCMKTQPWFIRVNGHQEWKLAVEFARSKGIDFFSGHASYYGSITLITNVDTWGTIPRYLMHGYQCGTKNEIKLSYKKVIDKVEYPVVKSVQELEIEKIEDEMRKLADRLSKLKGN